jgi:hypothetical protein
MRRFLFALGAALSVSACFALTGDVGGLHGPAPSTDVDAAPGPPRANDDLAMSFNTMYEHVNQLFEFVVVDDSNNLVQTRGIVLPLKMTDGRFKISVPQAIPNRSGPYRIDFWADYTLDGKYNYDHANDQSASTLNDHSWRVSLDDKAPFDPLQVVTHMNGRYGIDFTHHREFIDLNEFPDKTLPKKPPIETGMPAVVHIDNLAEGKMVQFRIADPSTFGHVVGLFRFRSSTQVDFVIPGCVENGQFYDVDLYVDANGNNDANGNGYDDPSKGPGNDLGWRLLHQPADDTGLHVIFNGADTATGNVDVGPP